VVNHHLDLFVSQGRIILILASVVGPADSIGLEILGKLLLILSFIIQARKFA
jgi:hypothetical protein